jgi:hypothetical protein
MLVYDPFNDNTFVATLYFILLVYELGNSFTSQPRPRLIKPVYCFLIPNLSELRGWAFSPHNYRQRCGERCSDPTTTDRSTNNNVF